MLSNVIGCQHWQLADDTCNSVTCVFENHQEELVSSKDWLHNAHNHAWNPALYNLSYLPSASSILTTVSNSVDIVFLSLEYRLDWVKHRPCL